MIEVGFDAEDDNFLIVKFQYRVPSKKFDKFALTFSNVERKLSMVIDEEVKK